MADFTDEMTSSRLHSTGRSTGQPAVQPYGSSKKTRIAGMFAVAVCVLACSLPVLGGLAAGSFVDRVFDAPVITAVVVSTLAIGVIVVVRRRGSGGHDARSC